MSTTPEQSESPQPNSELVAFGIPATTENGGRKVLAESAAELERRIEYLQDKRKEDHFFWAMGVAVVFAVWMYNQVGQSLPVFFSIFALEVVLLFGLATRLQVDWAVKLLSWLIFKLKVPDK